jgi:pimeloyl-ACP methyl ester carboxylesterase
VYNAPTPAEARHPGRQGIVIGVHGWTSDPTIWWRDGSKSWNMPGLGTTIRNALSDPSAWDVWGLDWTQGAATSGYIDSLSAYPLTYNEINAQLQGQYLAKTIADGGYSKVVLLGHSLGGRVIESASTVLSQIAPGTKIETVFLDPYVPYNWNLVYGSTSTYSEQYYTGLDTISGSLTATPLPNALNVDVSAVIPSRPSDWNYYGTDVLNNESWNHNGPIFVYKNTVQSPTEDAWGGYGFNLSLTSGVGTWPPTNAQYAMGQNVVLNASSGTTSEALLKTFEVPASAVSRPITGSAITGSANAVVDDVAGLLTLSAYSASGQQMGYASLTLTTTQPINFLQFNYHWINMNAGQGRVTFYLVGPNGVGTHLLWASDSVNGFDQDLSTGKIIWTGTGDTNNPVSTALAPGTYQLQYRLDYLQGEQTSISVDNIKAGLLAMPEPSMVCILLTTGLVAMARRRRAACPIYCVSK